MNIHDESSCVNKDSKRCTMDEKSMDYRLWLYDQATLRQKQRSKDQLERIGKKVRVLSNVKLSTIVPL